MSQRVRQLYRPNRLGVLLQKGSSKIIENQKDTHQPIPATNNGRGASNMLSKREHVQLPFLDDDKNVHPVLRLCSLACGLPVLLATKHPFLGPRSSQKCEFLIGDANIR